MNYDKLLEELIINYNIADCCPRFRQYLDAKRLLNELTAPYQNILLIENRMRDAAMVKSFIECSGSISCVSIHAKERIEDLAKNSEFVLFVSYSATSKERKFLNQITYAKDRHVCYLYEFLEDNGVLCKSEFYDVLEGERIGQYGEKRNEFYSTRYYGAIYRDKKGYLSAEGLKRSVWLKKVIFDYLFIRDFVYAEKYIEEYIGEKYPHFEKYQLFLREIKNLLSAMRKKTQEKRDHFFWFWLDALGYAETSGMPFINSLKGMVFENAFTVTPTTSLTMMAMFLRKRFYEDCAYAIDYIEEDKSPLIQYLLCEGYQFKYFGFEERFEEKLYGKFTGRFTPASMLNWYLLCDICNTHYKKCYLLHYIAETHPPFESGILEKVYYSTDVEIKKEKYWEERKVQWELAKRYFDEQLSFLSDFLNPNSKRIYMSDHSSGMTPLDEVSKVGGGTHTNLIVAGEGIQIRQIKKYFNYIDFDNLIRYVVDPREEKLDGMLDDHVIVEYPEKYSLGLVKPLIEQQKVSLDSFGWKQCITDQDIYVVYSVGEERYFTAGSWVNRIDFPECQERIEYLRGLTEGNFGDVYGDDFFENSRFLYGVWERYQKRTGGIEPGILLLKEAVAEIAENQVIAIRSGGMHTIELLSALGKDAARVRYIIDKNKEIESVFKGPGLYLDVITPDEMQQNHIDVVIVSSFRYREEIKEELLRSENKYQIIDIYDMLEERGIFLDRGFYEQRILPEDYNGIDVVEIMRLWRRKRREQLIKSAQRRYL